MSKQLFTLQKSSHLILLIISTILLASCINTSSNKDHPEYFDPVISKAKSLCDSGYPIEAFAYLDSSYSAFKNPSKYDLFRKYQIKADYYSVVTKDYTNAIIYADSMILMLGDNPEKYVRDYSNSLITKGNILFSSHQYGESFKCYYDGKEFAMKYNDSCSFAALSNGLGHVLFSQQKFEEAVKYFKSAYIESNYCEISDFVKSFELKQGYLNNAAVCYERLGLLDSAIHYYQQALIFVEDNEKKYISQHRSKQIARAVIMGNLGGIYTKQGNYTEAESLLKKSISINNRKGYDIRDAQLTTIKLADLYLTQKKFDSANEYMNIARKSIDSLNYDLAELRWRKFAWKFYDATNNIEKAYYYHQYYTDYKSKYDSIRKELGGVDFANTFLNLSQQYQIKILKKDNKLKSLYLSVVAVLSIMVLFIIYLIWRNFKLSSKNVKELTELNKKISELNVFKDKILAIMAHDIRGPIASLTGLISIENDTLKPELIENAKVNLKKQLIVVNDLLDNLLRWASSSFQKNEEHIKENTNITDLLTKNIAILSRFVEEKNINIINNVNTDIYAMVNQEQIKIVFRNIIANAIKFTPNGGSITIDANVNNNLLNVTIKDSGIGMTEEQKQKLFTHTYNSSYGTNGEKGIGLGLLITKEYLEINKGKINIQSEEQKGTSVIVTLSI